MRCDKGTFIKGHNSGVNPAILNRINIALAFGGIFVAGALSASHIMRIELPCGPARGCAQVAMHPSSYWFGVPVAFFGLAAYLTVLFLLAYRAFKGLPQTRRVGQIGFGITLVGSAISVWLTIVSWTVINALCPWCLASAAIMIALFLVHAFSLQIETAAGAAAPVSDAAPQAAVGGIGKADALVLGGFGVACVGALAFQVIAVAQSGPRAQILEPEKFGPAIERLVPKEAFAKGPEEAPVTIVEFADLFCGACRRSYGAMQQLMKRFPNVRVVFRHFPLVGTPGHEQSLRAAIYAYYAGENGKYWAFIESVLGAQQPPNDSRQLAAILESLNLDPFEAERMVEDTSSSAFLAVYEDMQVASNLGVQATPTFFVKYRDKVVATTGHRLEETLNSEPFRSAMAGVPAAN